MATTRLKRHVVDTRQSKHGVDARPCAQPVRSRRGTILVGSAIIAVAAGFGWWSWRNDESPQVPARTRTPLTLEQIPVNGNEAFAVLESLCALGPRPTGSEGMRRQQEYLSGLFTELGGQVSMQSFQHRHPETGQPVQVSNMIVEWHPERTERVLLCAHYDTRPYPDQDPDPRKRNGVFVGANDGASGVAVLAELGRHMASFDGPLGVDFVLFDAEEFIFEEKRDHYFIGSEYFARNYVASPPGHRYRYAVLLDMVGDRELRLLQEGHSMSWRNARPLVQHIWRVARRLGVREFIPRVGIPVRDDHLALYEIAKIPACDLIDFDYPRSGSRSYWHTTHDTPDKCDPLSLAKVGWVLLEWLREVSAASTS